MFFGTIGDQDLLDTTVVRAKRFEHRENAVDQKRFGFRFLAFGFWLSVFNSKLRTLNTELFLHIRCHCSREYFVNCRRLLVEATEPNSTFPNPARCRPRESFRSSISQMVPRAGLTS